MYDIHSHILPGVDDGADSLETSLAMVKMAYDEGIRHSILTPHHLHPLGYIQTKQQEVFEQLKEEVQKAGIEMELSLGAENYISRRKLEDLSELSLQTMGESSYVLVEFSRDLRLHELDSALHQLRLQNYRPIVAHVELYHRLHHKSEDLRRLKSEGALFQLNGNHLIGEPSELRHVSRKYVKQGLIDFIATDCHNMTNRKPELEGALKWLKRNVSPQQVEMIFMKNPRAVLENRFIQPSLGTLKAVSLRKGFRSGLALGMSCFLIAAAMLLYAKEETEQEKALAEEYTQIVESEVVTSEPVEKVEPSEVLQEVVEVESINSTKSEEVLEVSEPVEPTVLENTEDVVAEQAVSSSSHEEEVIANYVSYLENLQAELLEQADQLFQELLQIREMEDPKEKERLALEKQSYLADLEAQVDEEVNKLLYDMQNDLYDYGYEVDIVQELRDSYFNSKVETLAKYREKFEASGS